MGRNQNDQKVEKSSERVTHLVDGCLAATSGPHQHHAVSDQHGLVELDDLHNLGVHYLQTLLLLDSNDLLLQAAVVVLGDLHTREQVGQDSLVVGGRAHRNRT